MANQDEFFKINGAKELGEELRELSRGMQNKILRPALRVATAEVRKVAGNYVPVKSGVLKKSIKSKVFTAKRGAKGVVGRIGVFIKGSTGETHPAKYGAVLEHGTKSAGRDRKTIIGARNFLSNALSSAEPQATSKFLSKTQEKMDEFHAKQSSKYKK